MADDTKNDYCHICKDGDEVDIYICRDIGEPYRYVEAVQALSTHAKDRRISVHINSNGGVAWAAIMIANAMRGRDKCQAILEGDCCSAATFLALSASEIVVRPHSYMMFHDFYTASNYVKSHELEQRQCGEFAFLRKAMAEIYKGFLTAKEIKAMFDGRDYYLDEKEIVRRLKGWKR